MRRYVIDLVKDYLTLDVISEWLVWQSAMAKN